MTDLDNTDRAPAVYALITAAGSLEAASGNGRQLLPFRGRTVLETLTETLLAAPISGLAVVTNAGVDDELDLNEDPRFLTVVIEPAEDLAVGTIGPGIEALRGNFTPDPGSGLLVCPAGFAEVDVGSVAACIGVFTERPDMIVEATYRDRRGFPVILPLSLAASLSGLPAGGLPDLLALYPERIYPCECDDPGVCQEVASAAEDADFAEG